MRLCSLAGGNGTSSGSVRSPISLISLDDSLLAQGEHQVPAPFIPLDGSLLSLWQFPYIQALVRTLMICEYCAHHLWSSLSLQLSSLQYSVLQTLSTLFSFVLSSISSALPVNSQGSKLGQSWHSTSFVPHLTENTVLYLLDVLHGLENL